MYLVLVVAEATVTVNVPAHSRRYNYGYRDLAKITQVRRRRRTLLGLVSCESVIGISCAVAPLRVRKMPASGV
jgi:hypothetical protein